MEEAQIKNLIISLGPQSNDDTKFNAIKEFVKQVKLDPSLRKVFAKNKGISALVRVLKSKTDQPTSPTLRSAISLLIDLSDRRQYAALMAKKGACEALVYLSSIPKLASLSPSTSSSPSLQLDVLTLLRKLSEESSAVAYNCGAVGAFKFQLSELANELPKSKNVNDVVQAITASVISLEMFSKSPAYLQNLNTTHSVESLVLVLQLPNLPRECLSSTMGTLATLAGNSEMRTQIAKFGGVAPIAHMLTSTHHPLQTGALRAIANLAINLEIQTTLSGLGVIPTIVDMLRDPTLQEPAATALQHIAYRNQPNQEAVVKAGGLQFLIGMLKMESTNVKARAALAIFFLVHQKPHQDMASTCIPLLVELVSNKDEKCKINSIKALGSLANKHAQNKNSILSLNGISPVINYLKSISTKREDATEALGRMAGDTEIDKVIVNEGGLDLLISVMSGSDVEKATASETISAILEKYVDSSSFTPHADKLNSAVEVKKFVLEKQSIIIATMKNLLLGTLKLKCSAVRLLATLAALNIKLSVEIKPVIDVLNSGTHLEYALRLIYQSFKIGETPATQLQSAIPGLNLVLKSADPESTAYKVASKYLMLMLSDPETVGEVSQKTNSIRLIEQYTSNTDDNIKHMGIDALWTLLESDMTCEETVVENGGIGLVISVLESQTANSKSNSSNTEESDDLLRAALSTVRILAFSYSDQLAQQGIVNHLLAIIMEKPDRQMQTLVLQALWVILVSGSKIGREMLVKEGGVDVLVELVGNGKLNMQGKTYAEQCIFLLRAAGDAGFTSITDEKNYQRKCICSGHKKTLAVSPDGSSLGFFYLYLQLMYTYESVTAELLLHTTACNSANEHCINSKLTNVLLYLKNAPDKLIKGLTIPSQLAIVDTLAAQARSLPRIDDELRSNTEHCIRSLYDISASNNKDPLFSQLSDLRRVVSQKESSLKEKENETKEKDRELREKDRELREIAAKMEHVNHIHEKLNESKNKIQELESELGKQRETLTKALEDKKKRGRLS